MTGYLLSGSYFGDDNPSNSLMMGKSPIPNVSPHDFEASKDDPLLGSPVHEDSLAVFNGDNKNSISPRKGLRWFKSTDTTLSMNSPTTYDTENQIYLRSENDFAEQVIAQGGLSSQDLNSRPVDTSENVPNTFGNITLMDLEPYNLALSNSTVLDPMADVVPNLVFHRSSTPFLPDKANENVDSPSLEIGVVRKLQLNSPHLLSLTELELPPSSPPTSSPPLIFSSSPFASSQASETSDECPGEILGNARKYVEAETSNENDRKSPSVMPAQFRYNDYDSPGSSPPDPGGISHLSSSSSHHCFPHTEPLARQPLSFVPKEIYDPRGNEVYSVTNHISQILSQDPKLLLPTLPDLNTPAPNSSPPVSSTANDSMTLIFRDPADTLDALPATLTLDSNIEERSALLINLDASPRPSLTLSPLSSSLDSPLSSSPLLMEASCAQSIQYPAQDIPVAPEMNAATSEDGRACVPLASHLDRSQSTLVEGIKAIQNAPWETPAYDVALENTKSPDAEDMGDFVMDLHHGFTSDLNLTSRKRKRDDVDITSPSGVASTTPPGTIQGSITQVPIPVILREDPGLKGRGAGRQPNPKRSTVASQKMQLKKLATPFRSPLLQRARLESPPNYSVRSDPTSHHLPAVEFKVPVPANNEEVRVPRSPFAETTDIQTRHRTRRASSQFKSPLSFNASSRATSSLVRLTPTIQTLERKLQILKRAIKVKHDGDEEVLEALVKKWTEAGREVAWGIWELVKDNASSDDGNWGEHKRNTSRGAFEKSWGWDEHKHHNTFIGEERERNWGWDVVPIRRDEELETKSDEKYCQGYNGGRRYESEDEEKKQDTLGTMLVQMGVAPDTLGWDEEQGTFVGD